MSEDKLILEAQTIGQLTPAQVLNYLHARYDLLRKMIADWPPAPTDEVTALLYKSWLNRYCIFYGRVMGSLEAAQAFGHIDVPTFEALKVELIGIVSRNVAASVIGG